MKKILKIMSGVFGLCVLVIAGIYLQDHRFWDRYVLLNSNGGILPQEGWAGSEYLVEGGDHDYFELVDPSEHSISDEALQAVADYAEKYNSSSLLVWHRGKLQLREHFQGMDSESLIVGKSMAKMVVGIVVGRAIEEGYIPSLDEPAATYISEWQGTEKDQISIRHMLHMASGFEPYYTLDYSPFGKFMRSYIGGKTENVLINGYDLVDEPGTKYDYSQVTSDLLSIVLERATGVPYGQYLSESLIQPIGAQGGEVMMNRPEGLAHTGCCLLLPSESWLRIGLLLLNAGVVDGESLLPEGWMDDYLAPSPANPAMGLHIWLGEPYLERRSWSEVGEPTRFGVYHSEPYLAPDLFMFDGNANQVVYIIPSQQLIIVRTGGWNWGAKPEWDNAFLPNRIMRAIDASPATRSSNAADSSDVSAGVALD